MRFGTLTITGVLVFDLFFVKYFVKELNTYMLLHVGKNGETEIILNMLVRIYDEI